MVYCEEVNVTVLLCKHTAGTAGTLTVPIASYPQLAVIVYAEEDKVTLTVSKHGAGTAGTLTSPIPS